MILYNIAKPNWSFTPMRRTLIALALASSLGSSLPVLADDVAQDGTTSSVGADDAQGKGRKHADQLDAIVVNAVPGGQKADQIVAPVAVLAGSALDDAKGVSLGDTVSSIPGVQSSASGRRSAAR